MLVDVHTHLSHERFKLDYLEVVSRARSEGVGAIVCNGLEPESNRFILSLNERDPLVKVALGIYPVDAVNHLLPEDFPHRIGRFSVDQEIAFIEECAASGKLVAIGECGLDGHWLGEETFPQQIAVFERLIDIAIRYNLPVIIHTRKLEEKAAEVLSHLGAKKVNFHCFGGKSKWALQWSEREDWCFSIPTNSRRNELFGKLLRHLPLEKILTETDAPYLPMVPGQRSEPRDVKNTVEYLAELRGMSFEDAREQVWTNFLRLFPPGV